MNAGHRLPVAVLALPVLSTLLGGWLAIRANRWRGVLVSLGAGLLLGTAFLDLLPEALLLGARIGQQPGTVLAIALFAFLAFFVFDSAMQGFGLRRHDPASRKTLGRVTGSLLILHSFRDGMVIGAAFSASSTIGAMVALGIVAHDLGDGMNTILLATGGQPATRWDILFLAADALAPLLGGLLTLWWAQSAASAVILLAIAAGFFLQMATSDFLPSLAGSDQAPRYRTVLATLTGVLMVFASNRLLTSFLP